MIYSVIRRTVTRETWEVEAASPEAAKQAIKQIGAHERRIEQPVLVWIGTEPGKEGLVE